MDFTSEPEFIKHKSEEEEPVGTWTSFFDLSHSVWTQTQHLPCTRHLQFVFIGPFMLSSDFTIRSTVPVSRTRREALCDHRGRELCCG